MIFVKMNKAVLVLGKYYLLYPHLVTSNNKNGGFTIEGKEVKPLGIFNLGIVSNKKPIYFYKPLKAILLDVTLRLIKDFDGPYVNVWWKIQQVPTDINVTSVKVDFIVDKKHRLFKALEEIKNIYNNSKNQ